LPDTGKDFRKYGSRDYQDISICKKHTFLVYAIPGSKCNIIVYGCSILDAKPDFFVSTTESAFIVGAANCNLQDNAMSLTGRANYISFIVHDIARIKIPE
jgi:hypothetical protein